MTTLVRGITSRDIYSVNENRLAIAAVEKLGVADMSV